MSNPKWELSVYVDESEDFPEGFGRLETIEGNSWPTENQTPLTREEALDAFAVISSAAAVWFSQREKSLKRRRTSEESGPETFYKANPGPSGWNDYD